MKFSIVCPVKDEVDLIPLTLPSFYAVNPSEVVLCLDNPAPPTVVDVINEVAEAHSAEDITRIVGVHPRSDYLYQQAWIRRKGFHEAEHDRILTTDIDLLINENVLKAVGLVGKNDVGLVSLCKERQVTNVSNAYEHLWKKYFMLRKRKAGFSGLYAMWRPYWLESEPENKVKRFVGVKTVWRGENGEPNYAPMGEDTHLKNYMARKHRCLFLPDVGATILREKHRYIRWLHYMRGRYAGKKGRKLKIVLAHTLMRGELDYLKGYLEVNKK